MTINTVITFRCKAFGKLDNHKVMVDSDGTVRVFDEVKGYYSTCHSMSTSAKRKAYRQAAFAQFNSGQKSGGLTLVPFPQ